MKKLPLSRRRFMQASAAAGATAAVSGITAPHVYADGDDLHTVSVTVTDADDPTDSDTETFEVTVDNVAPTISLEGADAVD